MAQPKPRHPAVILVLGGARSGKSRLGQRLAEAAWKRPCYVATSEILDAEMAERIRKHQADRGPHWATVEVPVELPALLRAPPRDRDGLLVDCLTLWISNVLLKEGEAACEPRTRQLVEALANCPTPVVLVSNEVGLGLVPDNPLGRQFRDAQGRLNQAVAQVADTVVFVAAGLPLVLKGRLPRLARGRPLF
jgi:adenosylcobinamide kinase/adenosylcobinamide-phosphate guanylyltransferase